jgi:hypothetical protein
MNVSKAFTSIGAFAGIAYGVSKNKSFWGVAGYSVLFAIAGAALGSAYESFNN